MLKCSTGWLSTFLKCLKLETFWILVLFWSLKYMYISDILGREHKYKYEIHLCFKFHLVFTHCLKVTSATFRAVVFFTVTCHNETCKKFSTSMSSFQKVLNCETFQILSFIWRNAQSLIHCLQNLRSHWSISAGLFPMSWTKMSLMWQHPRECGVHHSFCAVS